MVSRHTAANIGLVDGGNSRIHLGVWDGNEVIFSKSHAYPETDDSLKNLIVSYLDTQHITSVVACSVSKQWRDTIISILKGSCGDLRVARTASDIGVNIPYARPENYGIDRALGVLRAYDLCGGACVIIDAGSAVTVDAVDKNGNVAGGYISAGLGAIMHGLSSLTGLPDVDPVSYGAGIGIDTESSIGHGIGLGYAGAVERLAACAASQVGETDQIYISGGDGKFLASLLGIRTIYRPAIVLEGLALAYPMLSVNR